MCLLGKGRYYSILYHLKYSSEPFIACATARPAKKGGEGDRGFHEFSCSLVTAVI